jgi:hypothetical protein
VSPLRDSGPRAEQISSITFADNFDYCPNHVEVPVMAEWKYKTQDDLRAAGYTFKNETRCIPCETTIEWWRTPAGKFMPLNYHTAQPHWITCKDPNRFRRKASGADVDEIARCGDHACAAIGCKATVPAKFLMCLTHWRQVPEPLAKALYDQFHRCLRNRVPLVTDPAYMAARQACINIVAKKEGVRTA